MDERPHIAPDEQGQWENFLTMSDEDIKEMYHSFNAPSPAVVSTVLSSVQRIRHERMRASTDKLTGLSNRNGQETWAIQHYHPAEKTYIAIAFDLEKFRDLNNSHGHGAGDAALIVFAQKLLATFRYTQPTDEIAERRQNPSADDVLFVRPGGDEFLVLLPVQVGAELSSVLSQITDRIEQKLRIEEQDLGGVLDEGKPFVPLVCRYGIAISSPDMSIEDLTKQADLELTAKHRSQRDNTDPAAIAAA